MRIVAFLWIFIVGCQEGQIYHTKEAGDLEDTLSEKANQGEVPARRFFLALRASGDSLERKSLRELKAYYWGALDTSSIERLEPIFRLPQGKHQGGWAEKPVDLIEIVFKKGASLSKGALLFESLPGFLFLERDQKNFLSYPRGLNARLSLMRDLDRFRRGDFFWWQKMVGFDRASTKIRRHLNLLNLDREVEEPLVAVIDSGVDYHHPALRNRLWENPVMGELRCGEDPHGCNTTRANHRRLGTPDVHPYGTDGPGKVCPLEYSGDCDHGTQVAGLILGDDPVRGSIGLCPMCRLMTLRVMEDIHNEAAISDFAIINALKYIALANEKLPKPVRVINASFGKFQRSKTTTLLLHYLREAYDTLIVAAAGNEATLKPLYPGSTRDVLSVGALNWKGHRTAYSNFGYHVNLFAPGGEDAAEGELPPEDPGLVTPLPGPGFCDSSQGTSFAAPVVSGAAGFFLALKPDLTVDELEGLLMRTGFANRKPRLQMDESLSLLMSGEYKKASSREESLTCSGLPAHFDNCFSRKAFLCLLLLVPLMVAYLHRRFNSVYPS